MKKRKFYEAPKHIELTDTIKTESIWLCFWYGCHLHIGIMYVDFKLGSDWLIFNFSWTKLELSPSLTQFRMSQLNMEQMLSKFATCNFLTSARFIFLDAIFLTSARSMQSSRQEQFISGTTNSEMWKEIIWRLNRSFNSFRFWRSGWQGHLCWNEYRGTTI